MTTKIYHLEVCVVSICISSNSFGEEIVDLEIGKKENRTSDTDRTTIADFLKVKAAHTYQCSK